MEERLINLEIKSNQMFELVVDDESFIDDIVEDLEKVLKLKVMVKNNSIVIIVNLDLSWDLQHDIIKRFIEYFEDLVYLCDCGLYEYKINILHCECGQIMCQDCKVLDAHTENEICMNCMENINNDELGDLI